MMTAARPLRLLYVLEYFPPHLGGVETLFDNATAALAREGHHVTVITLRVPGTTAREVHRGVTVRRIRTPRWARRGFFTFLAFPFVLWHARHADLIHAATPNSAVPAWFAAAITRTPAVHTVHEVFAEIIAALPGLPRWRARVFQRYERMMLRLPFAHYFCDSRFTQERLIRIMRVAPERTSVLYPALDYVFWDPERYEPRDLKSELGMPGEAFLYLYFGRPGFLKGVEYLIDAASRVREQLPTSRLLMLLDRDPPDQYERLLRAIAASHLDDGSVVVRDPVPRAVLPTYLLGADCVVVPSLSEGFGYAAVEAATLGCPLITTSGHSLQEVLDETAIFVPPRDAAALADAIVAAAATSRVPQAPRRFDLETHTPQLEATYREVISQSHQRATSAFTGEPAKRFHGRVRRLLRRI